MCDNDKKVEEVVETKEETPEIVEQKDIAKWIASFGDCV
jgi:hypothetical protein